MGMKIMTIGFATIGITMLAILSIMIFGTAISGHPTFPPYWMAIPLVPGLTLMFVGTLLSN